MNVLELFAGAGGGILGSRLLGHRTVCAVEIDSYCREILLRRQEEGHLEPFPIWDDIRTFDGRPWRGAVDIIAGGFPCQPYSTAARGRNSAECLFVHVERILAEVQPRHIILENVLEKSYPKQCHNLLVRATASHVGAPHRRPRYWLVAHADDTGEPAEPIHVEMASISKTERIDPWKEGPNSVLGMDDGVAHRMDRLRALGNGQVPRVVQETWG